MKFLFIIDGYPQSESQQERLLSNLKKLKSQGIDVLLTSHYPCPPEIIENTKYYLFEKDNPYHYLDSDVLNENINDADIRVFMRYYNINNQLFYDRTLAGGWSIAIISQLFNSIKFLYSKGYDYAFYLVDDFICPDDMLNKVEEIFKKSAGHRNYFIKEKPGHSDWYLPFFFGFTIDQKLIDRIPNLDFSNNKTYQKFFSNCYAEDVIYNLWSQDNNYLEDYYEMHNLFGENNYNISTSSSLFYLGDSHLHNNVSSSIYVNSGSETNKYALMLFVGHNSPSDKVQFNMKLETTSGELLYQKQIELNKGYFYLEYLDRFFGENDLVLKKEVIGYPEDKYNFKDTINIKMSEIGAYSRLKEFRIKG